MTNRVLDGVAEAQPRDLDELMDVSGIRPRLAEKFGDALLELVSQMTPRP